MNKAEMAGAAQDFILDCPFGRWIRFSIIPDYIFDEVFELIEERFRGWVYQTNDDDTAFMKLLEYSPSKAKAAATIRVNHERYKNEMFKLGESG